MTQQSYSRIPAQYCNSGYLSRKEGEGEREGEGVLSVKCYIFRLPVMCTTYNIVTIMYKGYTGSYTMVYQKGTGRNIGD